MVEVKDFYQDDFKVTVKVNANCPLSKLRQGDLYHGYSKGTLKVNSRWAQGNFESYLQGDTEDDFSYLDVYKMRVRCGSWTNIPLVLSSIPCLDKVL